MAPKQKYNKKMDPKFYEKIRPFLKGLWDHYFRCDISGWEKMPEAQAVYVGNHNGLLTFEVLMLFYAWRERFGEERPAVGLAHGVVFNNPAFAWLIPKIGAIPASPESADAALSEGYSLLVYPGGEKESFRPFYERKRVDFYGRKGFIKLALRNKVPMVPVVSIGAHDSYFILSRGEELAEKLGLKERFRLHGLPITFRSIFFLWCVVTGVFTFFPLLIAPAALLAVFIPLPAKMSFEILDPIDPKKHWDESLSEEANLELIYELVIRRMQSVLSERYSKRRIPIIG